MQCQGCFAQHWCLEAVNTLLEGRALGEGDGWELCGEWAATLLLLCVVADRSERCWARTSHLAKLSACCKQPILGIGSVNGITWKLRAHLDCFREGMKSECCRHRGKEHPECTASCVKHIIASSFCQFFFFFKRLERSERKVYLRCKDTKPC